MFAEFIVNPNENWQIIPNGKTSNFSCSSAHFCSNQASPNSEERFVFGQTFEFHLKSKRNSNEIKPAEKDFEEGFLQKWSMLKIQNEKPEKDSTLCDNLDSIPQIHVRVSVLDKWDCKTALGFGNMRIPQTAGYFKNPILIWRPQITSPAQQLQKMFLRYSFDFDQLEQLKQVKALDFIKINRTSLILTLLNLYFNRLEPKSTSFRMRGQNQHKLANNSL